MTEFERLKLEIEVLSGAQWSIKDRTSVLDAYRELERCIAERVKRIEQLTVPESGR